MDIQDLTFDDDGCLSPPVKKSKNFSRSETRAKSQVMCAVEHGVRKSLQECTLSQNRKKLEDAIASSKNGSIRQRNLKALLYILECLFATVPRMLSFKNFEEAFNIYKSFVKDTEETVSKEDEKKRELRNLLCSRQNGLCI